MARTVVSQCIYHLAISPSHTIKQRNEQYQTCPNHICLELVHTAKPVPGKSNCCCYGFSQKTGVLCIFPQFVFTAECVCSNILQ